MGIDHRGRSTSAQSCAVDAESSLRYERSETFAPRPSRFGVILFWSAIACLIAARIALFDPAATRAVGSFSELVAPVSQSH